MASELRTRFTRFLTLRNFSPKTEKAYTHAVSGLAGHYRKSPDQLNNDQIQDYLNHLIEKRRLAWSSVNVAFSAFRCFYVNVLHWDETRFSIPSRKRGIVDQKLHSKCRFVNLKKRHWNFIRR